MWALQLQNGITQRRKPAYSWTRRKSFILNILTIFKTCFTSRIKKLVSLAGTQFDWQEIRQPITRDNSWALEKPLAAVCVFLLRDPSQHNYSFQFVISFCHHGKKAHRHRCRACAHRRRRGGSRALWGRWHAPHCVVRLDARGSRKLQWTKTAQSRHKKKLVVVLQILVFGFV